MEEMMLVEDVEQLVGAERAAVMRFLYLEKGWTLQAIGSKFGITRQRVHQIIPDAPLIKKFHKKSRSALLPDKREWQTIRFWSRVDVPVARHACWNWRGTINPVTGYGQVGYGDRTYGAHRFAYEIVFGPVPEGLHVCHSCDNPTCCNPWHLVAMPPRGNHEDAVRKGRKGGFARKLSREDIVAIQDKYEGIKSCPALAEEYGISPQYIYNIANNGR